MTYKRVVQVHIDDHNAGHLRRRCRGSTLWVPSLSLASRVFNDTDAHAEGTSLENLQTLIEKEIK